MRRYVFEEPVSRLALWSRRLALFSLAVLVVATLTFRLGTQSLQAMTPLVSGVLLAGIAGLLAVLAFVRIWVKGHKGVGLALQGFFLALLLLAPLGWLVVQSVRLPVLNDVTTDVDEPPAFSRSRLVQAARNGRVPPEQPADIRQKQRAAYPRVLPVVLDVPPEEAFELARRATISLRWQVIEMVPPGGRSGAGRIEASDRTRILRFVDDITIRIRPRADGSRIDIRSASRLGSHDFGANAKRILAFTDEVNALLAAK